jgi:putative membrane protein insertion efficiency factor
MAVALKFLRVALRLPQNVLITLVKSYRLLLSPTLGSACRFEPSCSAYSLQSLQKHGAAVGTYLTLGRLVRCHPWCNGGLDQVPEKVNFRLSAWFSVGRSAGQSDQNLSPKLFTSVTALPSEKKSS